MKYLEDKFRKHAPGVLTELYVPLPSLLIEKKVQKKKETKKEFEKKIEEIIDCLHTGAMAYSIGDYSTAIRRFKNILEVNWLENAPYFYLIKTIIKIDQEIDMMNMTNQQKNQLFKR